MAVKRACLTMEQRLKIIEQMESGQDQNFDEMAHKHGILRFVIFRLGKLERKLKAQ